MRYSIYLESRYIGEYDSQTLRFDSGFESLSSDVYFDVTNLKNTLAKALNVSIHLLTSSPQ